MIGREYVVKQLLNNEVLSEKRADMASDALRLVKEVLWVLQFHENKDVSIVVSIEEKK